MSSIQKKTKQETILEEKTGQPEALATFAAAARNDGRKADHDGLAPTSQTAAIPGSLASQHDAATRVLQEGVTGTDRNAAEAIDALPDRTAKRETAG